ncbi:MAG: hypothetical protein LBP59_19130 [Planctomycetaceae bacterium]|jgi:hypothetical protein|nr:hypothetical protein [Planctomycetaceae bacterium]
MFFSFFNSSQIKFRLAPPFACLFGGCFGRPFVVGILRGGCFAICLLLILTVSGCGGGDGMLQISGTVTLDGSPLETGNMIITAGDSPVSGCEIKNGNFTARVTKGDKKVSITAMKIEGEIESVDSTTGEKAMIPKYVPVVKGASDFGEVVSNYKISVNKNGDKFDIELKSSELLKNNFESGSR